MKRAVRWGMMVNLLIVILVTGCNYTDPGTPTPTRVPAGDHCRTQCKSIAINNGSRP